MPEDSIQKTAHWDSYWQGPDGRAQAVAGDSAGAALDGLWVEFFERMFAAGKACEIADIACGAGTVTSAASVAAAKLGVQGNRYWCIDISAAGALAASAQAAPAYAIAGDAAAAPFADLTFDIAASLFGAEYAGVEAFAEMGRIVRKGGMLRAVVHRKDGPLAEECAQNLTLINAIAGGQLIDCAKAAFTAGFALDRGGDERVFQAADRNLERAAAALQEALKSGPKAPALAFLHRVHNDLGAMYQRRQAYDPDDVAQWLGNIGGEATAYRARMEAMLAAALSRDEVAAINEMLTSAGLVTEEPGDFVLGAHKTPAAWIISAAK